MAVKAQHAVAVLLWVAVHTEDSLRDTMSAATRASSVPPGARVTSLPGPLVKEKAADVWDVMETSK